MNDTENSDQLKKILAKALAGHIGTEEDEIKEDDFFSDDLHMNPTDLADFVHGLTKLNIDTAKVNLESLETFGDLLEQLSLNEN